MGAQSDFYNWQNSFADTIKADIHKCLPAIVDTYDIATQTADVTIALRGVDTLGNEHTIAPLYNVPVFQFRVDSYYMNMPITKGTKGIILVMDKDIDMYKTFGGQRKPQDSRRHDLSDCLFLPGFYPTIEAIPKETVSENNMTFGSVDGILKATITKEGMFDVKNPIANMTMDETGSLGLGNAISKFNLEQDGAIALENALAKLGFKPDGSVEVSNDTGKLTMFPEGQISLSNDFAQIAVQENGDIAVGTDLAFINVKPSGEIDVGNNFCTVGFLPSGSIRIGNSKGSIVLNASGAVWFGGGIDVQNPNDTGSGGFDAMGAIKATMSKAKQDLINSVKAKLTDSAKAVGLWVCDASGTAIKGLVGKSLNMTLSTDSSSLNPEYNGLIPSVDFNASPSSCFEIPSDSDYSFGDGVNDTPFSIVVLLKPNDVTTKTILAKYSTQTGVTAREWIFRFNSGSLNGLLYDDSTGNYIGRKSGSCSDDIGNWHVYAFTYSGSKTNAGIKLYKDGVQIDNTDNSSGTYVAMEAKTAKVTNYLIGSDGAKTQISTFKYGAINIVREELSADKVKQLTNELLAMAGGL